MAFRMMTNPGRDLTPEHTKRQTHGATGELHPDIDAAYKYVDSVVDVSRNEMNGSTWHGWSLREAFLAGASYQAAKKKPPPARPIPLFPKTARDPFGMGDGCQAWFEVDRHCPACVTRRVCSRDGKCVRDEL